MKIKVRHVERFLVSASVVLMVVVFCHLFISSCGRPFPQRVRGPLAKQRYTQIGDLPQEELDLVKDIEIPVK